MKTTHYLLTVVFFVLFACQQEHDDFQEKGDDSNITQLSITEAQQSFAKVLSKAVFQSEEVRTFLKSEALAQFDNDHDIFYPFVKDKIVTGDRTFRDVLLSYCNNEDELIQIEESLLLLNILVPDLTWIGEFSAANWDIHDNEVVVICRDDDDNTLYENGESIGNLPLNEVPGFPCLVIKNNERLKVSNSTTRAGYAKYEFINDIFNAEMNLVQTRDWTEERDLETPDYQNSLLEKSQVPSIVKEAWSVYQGAKNTYERDYIYYRISPDNPTGVLNRNIRETLYRFRINPSAYAKIADQTGTYTFTFTNKSGFEVSNTGTSTTSKHSHETTTSTSKSIEVKVNTTVGSDNLGSLHLYYTDPVIRDGSMVKYGIYDMYTVSNGTVEAMIFPTTLTKE